MNVEQIKARKESNPQQIVSVRFDYHGKRRELDNVTVEKDGAILVGFEMRREGKFSYSIKRFKAEEISGLELIDPPHRQGPVIGR